MNELLDKLSLGQKVITSSWPEKFSTDCLERCVDVFRGLKSDAHMMIFAIDSQDYVGMLVHEFAKNNPETRELFSDQSFKILGAPYLIGRRILALTYSFLSMDFVSFEESTLDSCNKPILIFSNSSTFIIDCERHILLI
jgi:hypothetical protein